MLAGRTIQENWKRPGAPSMNNESTCSQCRHWDLEHVQWGEFDDETLPHREYLAHCMNPNSPCWSRFIEAHDGCGDFEPR